MKTFFCGGRPVKSMLQLRLPMFLMEKMSWNCPEILKNLCPEIVSPVGPLLHVLKVRSTWSLRRKNEDLACKKTISLVLAALRSILLTSAHRFTFRYSSSSMTSVPLWTRRFVSSAYFINMLTSDKVFKITLLDYVQCRADPRTLDNTEINQKTRR